MVIKKFIAATEQEATEMAKAELGSDVTIMNVKENVPHGIFRLFKKKTVEVTAAVDDLKKEELKETIPDFSKLQQAIQEKNYSAPDSINSVRKQQKEELAKNNQVIIEDLSSDSEEEKNISENEIEEKLNTLQDLLEKQIQVSKEEKKEEKEAVINKNQAYIEIIRKQLIENEVEPVYVDQIMDDIQGTLAANSTLDTILASVYQKIVLKIGKPHLIDLKTKRTKYIFFIGPTGVGKTTTIAKIASIMKLTRKSKVALITSDTYRIAAVEQLKTYANILDIPLKVVYTADEMEPLKEELRDLDLILVDTAGRSHNNEEQRSDIEKLLNTVPEEDREIFLVLSATTKYRDLVKISEAYSEIVKYNLIFTKLDETDTLGNIFNIRMLTGAPLSYATWGQNVPGDIGKIDAQKIAKQLLGGNS